tara:strand:- start:181 stop:297 length:117 start_codon:yes stop_codon:yes gene_type:complete
MKPLNYRKRTGMGMARSKREHQGIQMADLARVLPFLTS